jgi:hypothetical protein
MGKLAHGFGLFYGTIGLFYPVRLYSGVIKQDIVLSRDNRKIFDFLGCDYDQFLSGFDTIEDIYQFIISSKLFNVDMFKFENMNHTDRKRNLKRPTYNSFLKYLEDNNIQSKHEFKGKDYYVDMINETFPEAKLKKTIDEIIYNNEVRLAIKEKFNGKIIKEHFPSIKNMEIGNIVKKFPSTIDNFYEYIKNVPNDKLIHDIVEYLKKAN